MPPRSRLPGLADRILAYRSDRGMTQAELAARCGIRNTALSHWEKGIREPSPAQIVALCRALRVSADRLLGLR